MGLTGTPWRLDKKQWLGQKFEVSVTGPQPPKIVKQGGAVPARIFRLGGAIDEDELSIKCGEYTKSSIAKQATRPDALAVVLKGWQQHCLDRPALMVGATVFQARITARYFNGHGVRAEVITGKTSQRNRDAIINRLKTGETKLICSVGCLTAGFDCPPVSAILFVRKTKSKALFHQVCGRGARPHPGKIDYLILDFGNNSVHGNPMEIQNYCIDEPLVREAELGEKNCPKCGTVTNVFTKVCANCGHEFGSDGEELPIIAQALLTERL